MNFVTWKHSLRSTFPKALSFREGSRGLLFCLLALLSLLATHCSTTPMPPLPTSPSPDASLRVAILTPMTGELATFGETVRNGVTLAFEEWNDRGGANGRTILWVLEDTRCDPLTARQAAERVIQEGNIRFIVGGLCSEAAIPIAQVAQEHGALFVAATATHPLVTVNSAGKPRSLVFRAGFAYPYQGRAAARFALDELKTRRAAVLTDPNDSFVRSLADEFATTFAKGGGQVVATTTYRPVDTDFAAALTEIVEAGPDILYVPGGYPVANRVGREVQARDVNIALIGSELWDNGALDLEGLDGAYFTLHYTREAPNERAEAWRGRYLSAFAVEPDTLAALGYDAAGLLASAMDHADSLTPQNVAQGLETLEYAGVTGDWRFDAQHNPLKPVVVVRIQRGDVVFNTTVRP